MDRFANLFDPLPEWLTTALQWPPLWRLEQTGRLARTLALVQTEIEGKQVWMRLSADGRKWLSGTVAEQYYALFDHFRRPGTLHDFRRSPADFDDDFEVDGDFDDDMPYDPYLDGSEGDQKFLGSTVAVLKTASDKSVGFYPKTSPKEIEALRTSLYAALATCRSAFFTGSTAFWTISASGETTR